MIAPLKQSVQEFIYHGMKNVRRGRFVCPTAKEAPDLCVYEKIVFHNISTHNRKVPKNFVTWLIFNKGITIDVAFDVSNERKRTKEYWEMSSQLGIGSLVLKTTWIELTEFRFASFTLSKKAPTHRIWCLQL